MPRRSRRLKKDGGLRSTCAGQGSKRSGAFRVIRTGALLDFLLELFGSSMLFCLECPRGALLGQQFMKWHRIGARSLSSTVAVAAAAETEAEKSRAGSLSEPDIWTIPTKQIGRQISCTLEKPNGSGQSIQKYIWTSSSARGIQVKHTNVDVTWLNSGCMTKGSFGL